MTTKRENLQARKIRQVVCATGVNEHEAREVIIAEEWSVDDAVIDIRAEFTANLRKRQSERGIQ